MGKTVGIDLGTTNSCISVIDETGELIIIPNKDGARTTPSVVAFSDNGKPTVGMFAKRQLEVNPKQIVFGVKRLMGRRFDDPEMLEVRRCVPYDIVAADSGDAWVEVDGHKYSPPEISSFILRELKQAASDYLGEEVTGAVITVPAYFNDAQRQATRDAGRIAGLDVQRIVNEPTAAALAYNQGAEPGKSQVVAVYDLGGGTFDVSILSIADGVFTVLSTAGDTFRGGEDFDYRIVDWMLTLFQRTHGIDLAIDPVALQRLKDEAERVKKELSSISETTVSLPFLYTDGANPLHFEATLTRSEFEDMTADIVESTLGPCQAALDAAGLSKRQIDTVLLVGGMSRMPLVRQTVSEWFGMEADASLNPDEVVASGAAIQAGIVRGEITDVLLLDVTPLSLGVQTQGGRFSPVIYANTTIPCSHTEIFSTTVDNQEMVSIHVLQGERQLAKDNKSLAQFELHGIPPAPRGLPKIAVTFNIDENGVVSVTARDEDTGLENQVVCVADGGLSEAEIEAMITDAERNLAEDQAHADVLDMQNRLHGLLYTIRRSIEQIGNKFAEDELNAIQKDADIVEDLLPDATLQELAGCIDSLEAWLLRIAEVMYAE